MFFTKRTGPLELQARPPKETDDPTRPASAGSGDDNALGNAIRALRKSRGLKLTETAAALERSVGWLSQVERGLSEPSINDLRRAGAFFDQPLGFFFRNEDAPAHERGHVVRAAARRPLGNAEDGLVEDLLSPDLGGSFELIRAVFEPGAALEQPLQRETEEAGYIVSGVLDLEIAGTWHRLKPGDSFRFRAEPYRWRNPGDAQAVVIWAVSPPVY